MSTVSPTSGSGSGMIFPRQGPAGASGSGRASAHALADTQPADGKTPKPQATETIAARTGAMVDEIDFPGFVAGLVHGTFDAIVDASIRQMESYSTLIAAVAKTVDQFTAENVTPNQARDWLATRYPGEVRIRMPDGGEVTEPTLEPRADDLTPAWLADFDLDGQTLTTELLEEQVLPNVKRSIGAERHQLLTSMVLLGLNRVAVKDGSISAKVMFRAAARDAAGVQYATSSDPNSIAKWGERGAQTYGGQTSTMVSTLAVNAQNESSVRADLFGEVKLNFVSETLPLDKMVEPAKMAILQRNAPGMRASAAPAAAPAAAAPAAPAPGQAGA